MPRLLPRTYGNSATGQHALEYTGKCGSAPSDGYSSLLRNVQTVIVRDKFLAAWLAAC